MKKSNILSNLLSTVLLLMLLATQSFASASEGAGTKLAQYQPGDVIMSGASTAKVFGTDKGTNGVGIKDPYTGEDKNIWAGTFSGELDGNNVKFYCIDISHPLATWSSNNPHQYTDDGNTPQEISYILLNYYPFKTLPYSGSLAEKKEAAAVQLAIWHFADDLDEGKIELDDNDELKDRVKDIIKDAEDNASSINYPSTLTIVPASQLLPNGQVGQFAVYTKDNNGNFVSGVNVTLTSSSGTLSTTSVTTNGSGYAGPISLSQGGDNFAQVTATANVAIPTGTRFVHKTDPNKYQKLVLATPSNGTINRSAFVYWGTPQPLCGLDDNGDEHSLANMYTITLPNGDVKIFVVYDKGFNDNTYGTNAINWPGNNHSFNHLLGSDQLELRVKDGNGNSVAFFTIDYIDDGQASPSGYAAIVKSGNSASILEVNSTLARNFNDFGYTLTTNSPASDANYTPNASYPNWIFEMGYEATISGSAFGGSGFGSVEITDMHNSPHKLDAGNSIIPYPCEPPVCDGEIGNKVWFDFFGEGSDKNCNGIQDAGEPGIAGVKLFLRDSEGNIIDQTFTDANGEYYFSVTDLCESYDDCGVCDGKVSQLTLRYDGSTSNALITVIQDKNDDTIFDGIVQPGETFTFSGTDNGTMGTKIYVYINGQPANTYSPEQGKDSPEIHTSCSQPIYTGMILGDFTVIDGYSLNGGRFCPLDGTFDQTCFSVEVDLSTVPEGYTATAIMSGSDKEVDSNPNPSLVCLSSEDNTDHSIDFGFCPPPPVECLGEIGDYVFVDMTGDCNGGQTGSTPIVGAVVKMVVDGQTFTTTTGNNGKYSFSGLCAGSYVVSIVSVPAAYSGYSISTANTYTVNLAADNSTYYDADFGYCPPVECEPGENSFYPNPYAPNQHAVIFLGTDFQFTTDNDGFSLGKFVYNETPSGVNVPNTGIATLEGNLQPIGGGGDTYYFYVEANGVTRTQSIIDNSKRVGIDGDAQALSETWNYFVIDETKSYAEVISGPNTGNYYKIGPKGPPLQVGIGANDKNVGPVDELGASAWMHFYKRNPDNSFTKVEDGLVKDINILLDVKCAETCKNTIGDFIWRDSNVNGIQDNDEAGIEGVVVELTYGNTTITTTTDENGFYSFSGLDNGTYSVKVAASNYASGGVLESTGQTKWYATKKNQGNNDNKDSDAGKNESVTVTLDCQDNPTVDFGFYKTCVTILKEGPESANPGQVIKYKFKIENCGDITLSGGVNVFDELINPNGDHKINHKTPVLPGATWFFEKEYTVPQDFCGDLVNHAWAVGDPIDGSANVRDDAEWTTVVDCAPDCSGEIGDRIWLDYRENGGNENCNGIQNGSGNTAEMGIPNVKVLLKNANGDVLDSTFTNQNGNYKFTELCAGSYFVFVDETTLPDAYTPAPTDQGTDDTKDSDVNGVEVVLATDSSTDYTIDFGYCAPPQEPEVDIEVIKTSSKGHFEDGDQFQYIIEVVNHGPDDAHGVEVSDLLPDGVVYISDYPSAGSYDDNTGVWMVGNLANGASETLQITVQVDVEDVNNATFNLGVASDYNLFVLYDATQPSSDTEGRVAVGRNASFANYSVGDKLPANSGDVLVVGNDLQYTSGAIYNGDVAYGNSTNLSAAYTAVSITGGALRNDYPIDFAAAEAYLVGLSTTLNGYAVNGTTTFEWGGLNLTGTDPFLNVFSVNAADLTAATNMAISVPNGSVVLVNVSGDNISWSGGLTVTGTAIGNVLYNFKEATSITIQGIDVRGTILAPKAHVNFVTGVQNGQMICKSLEGMGQFNNSLFHGNIPVEQVICNIATLTGLIETDTNPNNNSDDAKVTINAQDNGNGGGGTGGGSGDGDDWEYVGSFLEGQIVWSLAYTDDGCLLVGTWGGAIYKSNPEGTEFTRINEGMTVGFIWSLLVKDGYFFAGTEQGVFKYNGTSWTLVGLAGLDVRSLVTVDGKIYAGVWGGGLYVSSDNGATWTQFSSSVLSYSAVQDITVQVDLNFNVELFVATLGNGVCFSPDGGTNWTKLNVGYEFIWSIASTSTGTLFAGTYGDGLYTSNDNGGSWTKVFGVSASYVYDITVDPNDNVYISTLLGGIYTSTDGGSSFNNVGMGGFGTSSVLAVSNSESSSVYVGTSDGSIYRKGDGSGGVTAVGDDEEAPKEFKLDQNYPNPFNPTTTIQFAIPKAGDYKVVVYNILGEQVAELLNTQLQAGVHKVEFGANNLASGIYIYQLIGNEVNFTKKMILMK